MPVSENTEGEAYERKGAAPCISRLLLQLRMAVQCGHSKVEDGQAWLRHCTCFRAVSIFKLPNLLALAVLFVL